MRCLLSVLAACSAFGLGCSAAKPPQAAEPADVWQVEAYAGERTVEGILFFSGRISQGKAALPKIEMIAIQKTHGRLKTLPDNAPSGTTPYFGFRTVGSGPVITGYLPHPLHPKLEAENSQGILQTHLGSVPEAEFSLRLPIRAGLDSIRFFEEDAQAHRAVIVTFALDSK